MTFANQMSDLEQRVDRLRQTLTAEIEKLPDNPRIKRINKRYFGARAGDVFASSNWSPEYHDFKTQYRLLVTMLNTVDPLCVVARLRETVSQKSLTVNGRHIPLHPDVVKHLQTLFNQEDNDDRYENGSGI